MKTKFKYKMCIEELNFYNTEFMWHGIQTSKHSLSTESRTSLYNIFSSIRIPSLPEELNAFYALTRDILYRTFRQIWASSEQICTILHKQFSEFLMGNFMLYLAQAVVSQCASPKNASAMTLINFHSGALTPKFGKWFERLIIFYLKSCLPSTVDRCQFTYHPNRSTEDVITKALYSVLTQQNKSNSYIRM